MIRQELSTLIPISLVLQRNIHIGVLLQYSLIGVSIYMTKYTEPRPSIVDFVQQSWQSSCCTLLHVIHSTLPMKDDRAQRALCDQYVISFCVQFNYQVF